MPPQAASSGSSHWNPLGWWRGCAARYQPQLRLWLLAGPSPATTAPASVRIGASSCEQIQTKSLQMKLEEFPFASEPSQLGSPWSTTSTRIYTAQCHSTRAAPAGAGDAEGALDCQQAGGHWCCFSAWPSLCSNSQGCKLRAGVFLILPMVNVCVSFGAACAHHSTPCGGTAPHLLYLSVPHTNFSSSSSQSFQSFSKSFLPSSLFQDLNFFLSIFQLSAVAVVLSFWWKTGYQSLSPQLQTFKFRPPHLQGTFKLGIKHCTWQRFPDPAQTIIKFICLRTCWTQTLFSLAQEANLLLKINIKQTGFFLL